MFLRSTPMLTNRSEKNATLEEQELVKEMDNIRDNWMPDVKNDTDELSMSWCIHVLMATTERSKRFHHNKIEETGSLAYLYSDHFRKVSKTSSTSLLF
jgi:hypothetical protein